MAIDQQDKLRQKVLRGKYRPLYELLCNRPTRGISFTFAEMEELLGCALPAKAKQQESWWSNDPEAAGHSNSLAWTLADYTLTFVDLGWERAVWQPPLQPPPMQAKNLDELWPVYEGEFHLDDWELHREDMYEDRGLVY